MVHLMDRPLLRGVYQYSLLKCSMTTTETSRFPILLLLRSATIALVLEKIAARNAVEVERYYKIVAIIAKFCYVYLAQC